MSPPRALTFLACLWLAGHGNAQDPATADPAKVPGYSLAAAAMRDGLPEVAIVKLQRTLNSGKLKPEQRVPVLLLLAEAQVRAGKPEAAMESTVDPAVAALPETLFWRAQSLARLDRWREAEELFGRLGTLKDFRYATGTVFSRAGLLAALGEPERAGRLLIPLRKSSNAETAARAGLWLAELQLAAGQPAAATAAIQDPGTSPGKSTPEHQYLRGRIALATGDAVSAEGLFSVLSAKASSAPPRLQQAATLGRVRALRVQGKSSAALAVLRQFISTAVPPPPEMLDLAFQELETLNQPPTGETDSFLNSLAGSADAGLRIRARIALAAAQESLDDPARAEAAWAAIPREFPENPLRSLAILRHAQFLTILNRRGEARPLLEVLRQLSPSPSVAAWTAWVAGQAEYDAGAYRAASGYFMEASATSTEPEVRFAASYNAALAELQSGLSDPERQLAMLEDSPLEEYRMAGAEFHLERALRMASVGDPAAMDGLKAFAGNLPDHPRRFDALIALAEFSLRSDPPDPASATRYLEEARAAALGPAQLERASLLECYVSAAGPGGDDAMAAKAELFLTAFPASAARTDLRMKVAQMYYRRENFAGARQIFEAIAADDPLHPLAEPALFWAGRAALLTLEPTADQQAVVLWEKVFQRGGPLKWQVRLQEALLNQRQKKPAAALQLLEEILNPAAQPPPQQSTRWQALSVKGEILASPGMTPEEQAAGLAAFDLILAAPGVPAQWHRQMRVRKGVCLEALKRPDEALEAYYDVLSDPPQTSAAPDAPPDDYWFHRAGDKARRLLEAAGKKQEAIEIVKKLAKAPGPRGRAAADLVDELALKYNIWTGTP